ncbi:MAG: lysophospholipid acyltransferase family protein [Candidatus Omnitrophota bacterium]
MIYYLTKKAAYFFFKIFYSLKVSGQENMPKKGPFVIVCNHVSNLDPILIGAVYKGRLSYVAKEELFKNRFIRWYYKKLSIFPIKRGLSDSAAMRGAIRRLKKGGGMVIFPEGTRSADDNISEGKTGISVLSSITKAKVVPCYVKGTHRIMPRKTHHLNKGKVSLVFGEPFGPLRVGEGTKKADYYNFAQEVMSRIKALKEKACYGED